MRHPIARLNPFIYPAIPHIRRHGPIGYTNYTAFKPWLRDEFSFRCVYCLFRERWYPDGQASFSVDHLTPQIQSPELICEYTNLVYACRRCNALKALHRVPDPCEVAYGVHLHPEESGNISALSETGEALILSLNLNDTAYVAYRQFILTLSDTEDSHLLALRSFLMRYPTNLPDLNALRPPGGNTLPEGMDTSYHRLRLHGNLPDLY
jgi:hypothetical protein